ncbi:MAG: hypothetical protein WDN49_05095 [Acetobacteraceae bacterium]
MSATVAHPGWRLDPRLGRGLAGLIVPLALLALWQTAAARGWLPPQILPSPADTWASGVDLWTTGELPGDIAISLLRVVEGFLVGALFGFVLGSAMGLSPVIEDYVRPLFIAIAQVPSLGWIPFLMLFPGDRRDAESRGDRQSRPHPRHAEHVQRRTRHPADLS